MPWHKSEKSKILEFMSWVGLCIIMTENIMTDNFLSEIASEKIIRHNILRHNNHNPWVKSVSLNNKTRYYF
jgi:hypothetical protein